MDSPPRPPKRRMKEHIEYFLELFPQMTQEDRDAIGEILRWDSEKKAAFFLAKRLFEEEEEE